MVTINDIYGEYGLSQNSTTDPYAQQEEIITEAAKRSLNQIASTNRETTVAKGFDTSFFDNGQTKKQQGDVLSNLYSTFAQNRINDVNSQRQMERNIVQNAATTETATNAQSRLLTQQYEQKVNGLTVAGQDLSDASLITKYSSDGSSLDADKVTDFANKIGISSDFISNTIGADSQDSGVQSLVQAQTAQQKELQNQALDYYATGNIDSYNNLMGYTGEDGTVIAGSIDTQANNKLNTISEQIKAGELSSASGAEQVVKIKAQQYETKQKILNYNRSQQAKTMPSELVAEFNVNTLLLEKKMALEKQQDLDQLLTSFMGNISFQSMAKLWGWNSSIDI